MRVQCSGVRELPPDWSEATARDAFEPFTKIAGTKVSTTGAPTACGRQVEVVVVDGDPGLRETWDVKTDGDGTVIERHTNIDCPDCGTSTFVAIEAS